MIRHRRSTQRSQEHIQEELDRYRLTIVFQGKFCGAQTVNNDCNNIGCILNTNYNCSKNADLCTTELKRHKEMQRNPIRILYLL